MGLLSFSKKCPLGIHFLKSHAAFVRHYFECIIATKWGIKKAVCVLDDAESNSGYILNLIAQQIMTLNFRNVINPYQTDSDEKSFSFYIASCFSIQMIHSVSLIVIDEPLVLYSIVLMPTLFHFSHKFKHNRF